MKENEYEYAGFIFLVNDGKLSAKEGQHHAAYKEKHLDAAQKCYDEEHPRRTNK